MEKISLVIPCYNEEKALPFLFEQLGIVAQKMEYVNFEFIFVDDGSKDKTLEVVHQLSIEDDRVHYVSFSRNFGKEAAILAGLKKAQGDYVALIDADLQDPPALLIDMYQTLSQGEYDCVATRRVSREGEPPIRSFFARMFYRIINNLSDTEIVDGARDFRMMTRQMTNAILDLSEYNRFSKGIFSWVGFKTQWIPFENIARVAGETKWSFGSLFRYSLEGVIAFSTKPLYLASTLGLIFCLISLVYVCFIIAKTILHGEDVQGYPTLICMIVFIGGLQLFCIGILGQYLSRTYLETKNRPIYIVKKEK